MLSRPPLTSRQTTSTLLSAVTTSYTSTDQASSPSTALTSPDLSSPDEQKFELAEVVESDQEAETKMDLRYVEESATRPLSRGPSVRDRASKFEQQAQESSSRFRPLPVPTPRTRSTSPLRINRHVTGTTPTNARRNPMPSTAPLDIMGDGSDAASPCSRRPSAELTRGKSSAKRMIQQWESLPNTPAGQASRSTPMSTTFLSREYLDQKPLPVPRANAVPAASANYEYSPVRSPARTAYIPSPLHHLQTPSHQYSRKRSSTLTPSPSSNSLSPSPSGEKRKKGGRSPLKEILNVFGGGIQAIGRKAKGKGKGRGRDSFGTANEDPWGASTDRVRLGTSGLPGGIVFSDRMGDQEMEGRLSVNPNVRCFRLRRRFELITSGDPHFSGVVSYPHSVLLRSPLGPVVHILGNSHSGRTQGHLLPDLSKSSVRSLNPTTHHIGNIFWSTSNISRALRINPSTRCLYSARRRACDAGLCRGAEFAQGGGQRPRRPCYSRRCRNRSARDGMVGW